MNTVLSPEEKNKQELAEQAQKQKRLAIQAEEQYKEEKIKLRRLKERQAFLLLTYLRIFIEEERIRLEKEELIRNLKDGFFKQYLQQAQEINQMVLDSLGNHDTAVSSFLFADESEEEKEKRNALLQTAKMNRTEFSALAIADLCRNPDNKEDVENVFSGKQPSDKLIAQRRESLVHADLAVADFSQGKTDKMESILKDGLENACHCFINTKDSLTAIHWSKQINGILSIINSHPVLFKDGVHGPMLEAATGMAAVGRVMENGLEALNELHSARLKGEPLTDEKEMSLQGQILLMQQADVQRSNVQFQKFFAKGYHPKNGLQQENLKNLLIKLNSSQAMYTLSAMDKNQKLFVLSDMESRRIISEDLFVPHMEAEISEKKDPENENLGLNR